MELHTYFSELGLLRLSWGERIDAQSLRRHFDLLMANKHYDRNLKVITSAPVEELGFSLTKENMLVIRQWREDALHSYESIMTAFYGIKPVPAAYIDYFSEFFDSDKSRLKLFSSREAAIQWLMPGYEPKGIIASCF